MKKLGTMFLQVIIFVIAISYLILLAKTTKRGPGRLHRIDVEEQKEIFSKFKDQIGQPVPRFNRHNECLYEELSEAVSHRMTKKAIYCSLKKNYVYFFETAGSFESTSTPCPSDDRNKSDTDDDFTDSSASYMRKNLEAFSFFVDIHFWKKIEPLVYFDKRTTPPNSLFRKRENLQKHKWTDFLREAIWKNTSVRCAWAFKRNYVLQSQTPTIITCTGYCVDCRAKLDLKILPKTENFIEIQGNYEKKIGFKHGKKIKMTKFKSQELKKKLRHKSALCIQNKLALNLINAENCEKPYFLPRLSSLHQLKHSDNESRIFHKNPVMSLWLMSESSLFQNVIKNVTLIPNFFTFYWTELQTQFYTKYYKLQERIILSIDATGSIFKNIDPPTNNISLKRKNKHILFYVVVAYNKLGSSVPVTQLITASQTSETISTWLTKWRSALPECPSEVITDDSSAIIKAAIEAFTEFSTLNEYLRSCFDVLEGRSLNRIIKPTCYLRLDTSHFIKALHRQNCFQFVNKTVKYFYIKCILLMKNTVDYNEVKTILKNVIVVSLNKNAVRRFTEAHQRLVKSLDELKSRDDFDHETNNDEYPDTDLTDLDLTDPDTILDEWFQNEIAKENIHQDLTDEQSDEKNIYYLPELLKMLTRILKKLPMWSNVLTDFFKSDIYAPSSSNVECYFKNIKNLFLRTKCNKIRVDEFIKKHCQFLTGEVKLALAQQNDPNEIKVKLKENKNAESKKRKRLPNRDRSNKRTVKKYIFKRSKKNQTVTSKDFPEESIFSETPTYNENWRGITHNNTHHNKKPTVKSIHLLKNGGLRESDPFFNTCAFDSLVQCLSAAYVMKPKIRGIIDNHQSDNLLSKLIISVVNGHSDIYDIRSSLLGEHFKSETSSSVDCQCYFIFILQSYCFDLFKTTWVKSCSATMCPSNTKKQTRSSPCCPFDLAVVIQSGVKDLQQSVLTCINNTSSKPCAENSCTGMEILLYTFSSFVAFEFEHPDIVVMLKDVPKCIDINDRYSHPCVVEFVGSASLNSVGHFKIHCYDGNVWYTFDDTHSKMYETNDNVNVRPTCIIYSM